MRSYKITEFGRPLEAVEEPTPEPAGAQVLRKVDAGSPGAAPQTLEDFEADRALGRVVPAP